MHPGKRGMIPAGQPRILACLGMDGEAFVAYADRMLKLFGSAVGAPASLVALCARRQVRYLRGMRAARRMFGGERLAA